MSDNLPRMVGKSAVDRIISLGALYAGEHVHSYSHSEGEMCLGGSAECQLFSIQLIEALEAWK